MILGPQPCDLHPFILRQGLIFLFRFETLLPASQQILVNPQVPGDFRDRLLLINQKLYGLPLELSTMSPTPTFRFRSGFVSCHLEHSSRASYTLV
jgi:hypothetical protein